MEMVNKLDSVPGMTGGNLVGGHCNIWAGRSAFESDAGDRALIASIAHRDQTAFRELHARYCHRITHFVSTMTRRSDIVDDVVNETLWLVWQRAASFRFESKVSTWIMGITRNLTLNALRTLTRACRQAPTALEEEAYEPWRQSELTGWIDEGLARLPSEQRTVLEMFYGLDESCEEIARALNCPRNTVKTRLFHGRRKLRELLPRLAASRYSPGHTIGNRYARTPQWDSGATLFHNSRISAAGRGSHVSGSPARCDSSA
jgi:RNA polymerase sigma-70 factor (ECF subfamily)